MIIDLHVHIGRSRDGGVSEPETVIRMMDQYGIDKTAVFATDEEGFEPTFKRQNTMVLDFHKQYPDRIIPFCRIVPSAGQEAIDEFKRCRDAGAKGLKLKTGDGFGVEQAARILELIKNERTFPVMVHTSHNQRDLPQKWEAVARQFPKLNFIFAHGAKDLYRTCCSIVKQNANIYTDATTLSYFRTRYLITHAGSEKLVFGSDFPYSHPSIEKQKYELALADEGLRIKIFSGNACRLLGLVT